MSDTSKCVDVTLSQLAREEGTYSEEAYHFLREGLEYAAQTIHGPMTPAQYVVAEYMCEESIELAEVIERFENGTLSPAAAAAIEQVGDVELLNRNVSGQDLCWALRDFARQRWGALADLVLRSWGVRTTDDFGRIVFLLVENGFMQKEPHDTPSDFSAVYDFRDAFQPSGALGERAED